MTRPHTLRLLVLVCFGIAASGCDSGPQIVPVQGKVLFRDKPLEFGSVMFQPVEGGQPARGVIQPDGTFSLTTNSPGDGATVGPNLVRITSFTAQRPGAEGAATERELDMGQSLIPLKYNSFQTSELEVEVLPDDNEPFVIELEDD